MPRQAPTFTPARTGVRSCRKLTPLQDDVKYAARAPSRALMFLQNSGWKPFSSKAAITSSGAVSAGSPRIATLRLRSAGKEYENHGMFSVFSTSLRYLWIARYSSSDSGANRTPFPKGRAFGGLPSLSTSTLKWRCHSGSLSTIKGGYFSSPLCLLVVVCPVSVVAVDVDGCGCGAAAVVWLLG